ncbi:MAG: sigma-70 family RNA polymerase sigma factor [Bacteroidales bacterium]|nr:sigma-70 family RNA polymerase sigma factor [Bacteroidales bacterium]
MNSIGNRDDNYIIELVKNGKDSAFTILVTRYKQQIAKTIIGMLGDCAEADDVGQETFVRFYKSINNYRGDASLGTYLTRIAINLSLNELKRRKRKQLFFLSNNSERPIEISDVNSDFEKKDTKEIVDMAIKILKPEFRSVVILRLVNGYSTKEAAEILNLPIGTVLSRLSRAQIKLKEVLKKLII